MSINNKRSAKFVLLVVAIGLSVVVGTTAIVLGTTRPELVGGGQVATLSWYANNYATGLDPDGVATDGTNIWTCNRGSVTKVAIASGKVLGTYSTPNGACRGIAFDGNNIWIANIETSAVSKIKISSGAVIGTYPLPAGSEPWDIVFGASSMWTANRGTSTVSKINVSTGAIVSTYTLPTGSLPNAIAFDGFNIWTSNQGTSAISKIDTSTDTVSTYPLPGGPPFGIAFDGQYIWTSNSETSSVSKIYVPTGRVIDTYSLDGYGPDFDPNIGPTGIAFDQPGYSTNQNFLDPKTYMWTANYNNRTVSKIETATGVVVGTYPVGIAPSQLVFDGTNIWVVNSGSQTVTKISAR